MKGNAWPPALAQHDLRARAAVEGNRGIIVKTTGDGLFAAFPDPIDAVNATVAFQQSLVDPAATNGIYEKPAPDYGRLLRRLLDELSFTAAAQAVADRHVGDDPAARIADRCEELMRRAGLDRPSFRSLGVVRQSIANTRRHRPGLRRASTSCPFLDLA